MEQQLGLIVHLGTTVGVDGMVCKSDLVALSRGVHDVLVVEVEEEGAHVLVVHLNIAIKN